METVPTTATNDTAPAPPDDSLKATNPWISVFGVYLIILNVVLIYLIFRVWPGRVPLDEGPARVTIIPGYYELNLWPEPRYMCIVSLVGAHAAYIHLATSFTEFLGNRNFYSSWKWWYGLRPFIGSALALLVYFAARGGLISGNAGAKDLSPYGIGALAALAGMFSKQATDKLREVFENLFKTTIRQLVLTHSHTPSPSPLGRRAPTPDEMMSSFWRKATAHAPFRAFSR